MRNNEVAKVEITSLRSLIESLGNIPDEQPGVNRIRSLLWPGHSPPPNLDIFGAVTYDYKAIYTYVVDACNSIEIGGLIAHPGRFVRWDNITNRLASFGLLYIPEVNAHYILERILGKQVWKDENIQGSLDVSDERLKLFQTYLEEADQVIISEDEAFLWLSKAFHNVTRSDIISRMVRDLPNRSMKDLYLAIGKYYSWRSATPHMQWWNIAKAEVLLIQPERERAKARAWLATFNEGGLESESGTSKIQIQIPA